MRMAMEAMLMLFQGWNGPCLGRLPLSQVMLIFALMHAFTCKGAQAAAAAALRPLEPARGAYLGVVPPPEVFPDFVSWESKTLGVTPALFSRFFSFPLDDDNVYDLEIFLSQVAEARALAMVTLEPWKGLAAVSEKSARKLASILRKYEKRGLRCIVRFAHEMNGAWYPWSQQPGRYKKAFRIVARNIKANTLNLAMAWAPNDGGGYPFPGAAYNARPGKADFKALDTNRDGKLSMADDMYSPYYPGDAFVDWVGLSLYSFGDIVKHSSQVAERQQIYKKITGTYDGIQGNQMAVPDFYALFSGPKSKHQKPMMIAETSAAYYEYTARSHPTNLEVKQSWFTQLFNVKDGINNAVNMRKVFPRLKLIVWFDVRKEEAAAGFKVIDWSLTSEPAVRKAFTTFLNSTRVKGKNYWLLLSDVRSMQ